MNKLIDFAFSIETSEEVITDNRRKSTLSTLNFVWSWLDCKRLRKILAKDVVLYEKHSPPICGLNKVLHCHTIWFDRMKACLRKGLAPLTLTPTNIKQGNNFSIYIKENIHKSDFMFVFNMKFSNDKIAEIEIIHNDFVRIMRKHEEIDIESEFENII